MAAYEVLLLNTAVPQIQAAQSGDTYVVPRDIAFSAALTLSGGTANGVPYLSSPGKVLTTGSALTFDGTTLTALASASASGNFKTTSTTAQVYNLTASNDANTTIGLGVYGSAAGTVGTLSAGTPFLATSAATMVQNVQNASGVFVWGIGATPAEQMRLTSTGLGIGTNNPGQKLHVVGASGSGDVQIGTNAGANQYQYITFGGSNGGTDFGWQIGRSSNTSGIGGNGALYFYDIKANANRMSIDSSGNLGLGVTPSASTSNYRTLQIGSTGVQFSLFGQRVVGNAETFVGWNAYGGNNTTGIGTGFYYTNSSDLASMYSQNGQHAWWIAPSGTAGNAISFTQAMTLDASGNLLVGTTSTAQGADVGNKFIGTGAVWVVNAATNDAFSYYNTTAAAYRFYVSAGGTISATNTTISAISDQRFKENIRDLDVGLNSILALKPRLFDWKAGKGKDTKDDRGFIAQEFEQVFPDLIDEWKDPAPEGEEPYKAVRADLIPVLVKAIQEQQAMINELKAEVAALKGA